jgi:hypothetical protein
VWEKLGKDRCDYLKLFIESKTQNSTVLELNLLSFGFLLVGEAVSEFKDLDQSWSEVFDLLEDVFGILVVTHELSVHLSYH